MKILAATNNPGKIREFQNILSPLGIDVVSMEEAGVRVELPEETGATFEENAVIKARAVYTASKRPCISDDSGLEIDALGGRPGVFSARYAGKNATDEDRINKVLSELKDVPESKRGARFACSVCCVLDDERTVVSSGVCEGTIANRPAGDGGFGYDPIFLVGGKKTFAQMSEDEKDRVSHRGKALREAYRKLSAIIDKKEK